LRAYRKTFMGTIRERWQQLPDLRPVLRAPITLLVAALLCYGFFPQSLVQIVAPRFSSYVLANTRQIAGMQSCSHGDERRPYEVTTYERKGPPVIAKVVTDKHGRGYSIR